MSRARENADGARLDAPLASPAFSGTPTGIVAGSMVDGTITAAKVAADVATQAELDAQRTNSSITTLGTVTSSGTINSMTLSDTGWVSISSYVTNDWVQYSNSYPVRYRIVGKIVFITGLIKDGTDDASEIVLTGLPSAIWPSQNVYFPTFGSSKTWGTNSSVASAGSMGADGSLYISHTSTSWTSAACSYVLG